MAEAAGADAGAPIGVWRDIKKDVVGMVHIARHSAVRSNRPEFVEPESIADAPTDIVIGAGGIAADADPADLLTTLIERKPAAKHVDPADAGAKTGGSAMPSSFAVLRLTTKSNFTRCCIGRSPGLAPRKIRST